MTTFLDRYFGLTEPMCDDDGLYDGCLAPPDQATFLYWMSWMGMVTGLIGMWNGYTYLGAGTCIGSVFAQMYWSNPTYSWRRTLDMSWVQLLIWTHLWVALGSSQVILYVLIQILGAISYFVSWMFLRQGHSWAGTFTHALIHLCANVSLLLLYTS